MKFVFDEDHRTLLETLTVDVGVQPTAAVLDSDGYIWSTCRGDDTLWKIDPTTNTVVDGYPVPTATIPTTTAT